jgi:hypothetical protein
LHPFIVELALDLQPFFPQSTAGQDGGKQPEWLGGFPDQDRRAGRKQRAGCKVCRGSKPGHAEGSHGDAQRARVTGNPHLTPHCPGIGEAR